MNILVTGARGFIGSAFIRELIKRDNYHITAFARNTQNWTKSRLDDHIDCLNACKSGKLNITNGDLNGDISGICERIDVVFNFAARTFVDHSIKDPMPFIQSNVLGTANIIEEARRQKVKAFFQISTDEVYGQILHGSHHEESPINPRNPYAASKAGADALVISYAHTFGMWTCVTRTENNYGQFQHPQKAIPVFIGKGLKNEKIPVYGDGQHVRQWLYVQDHIEALLSILDNINNIQSGNVFHIAGNQEITNVQLAKNILDCIGKPHSLIEFIDDYNIRPGHDRRYALTCDKLKDATGWVPRMDLNNGLEQVVKWYCDNSKWLYSV